MPDSHAISLKALFTKLHTSPNGLSQSEAEKRLQENGKNRLSEQKELPFIIRFLLQFNNFFSYLLLLGSCLSFLAEWLIPDQGNMYIAWALLIVTVLNATFTFFQETRARQAMKSFQNLTTASVVVIRDKKQVQISSEDLVPGDIIILSEGDKVSADARLFEVNNLKVDHSALTGERIMISPGTRSSEDI
jgi:sodium/potassium-transporting ATPase subunit alpha